MKVQPLRSYRKPTYPTRLDVLADSDVLMRNVPSGWKKTVQMASLAALFVGVNGCAKRTEAPAPKKTTEKSSITSPSITSSYIVEREYPGIAVYQPDRNRAAAIAPLFEHGDGIGSVGCMMVTAPVFLSEEEALQLIRDEFSSAGLTIGYEDALFGDVIDKVYKPGSDKPSEYVTGTSLPFYIDLIDGEKKVAVEFVSTVDCVKLGGAESMGSASTYGFKKTAKLVQETFKEKGKELYFGTFYDPVPVVTKKQREPFHKEIVAIGNELAKKKEINKSYDELNDLYRRKLQELDNLGKVEAQRLLRLQVRDFMDWLKGQGAI